MKLLEKNEIIKIKSVEKEMEIREGIKLAKKVDSLRELSAKEQDNLIKFRNETVRKVTNEVNSVIQERDTLKNEVISLKEQRKELLKPLDEEWAKIDVKQKELVTFSQELNNKYISFEQEKKDFEVGKTRLEEDKQRISEEKDLTTKNLADSEAKKVKIDNVLASTEETKAEILKHLSEKEQKLIARETNIASAERDIKNSNDNLEKEYQFINKEKARLADQRATLERAIARNNKK